MPVPRPDRRQASHRNGAMPEMSARGPAASRHSSRWPAETRLPAAVGRPVVRPGVCRRTRFSPAPPHAARYLRAPAPSRSPADRAGRRSSEEQARAVPHRATACPRHPRTDLPRTTPRWCGAGPHPAAASPRRCRRRAPSTRRSPRYDRRRPHRTAATTVAVASAPPAPWKPARSRPAPRPGPAHPPPAGYRPVRPGLPRPQRGWPAPRRPRGPPLSARPRRATASERRWRAGPR